MLNFENALNYIQLNYVAIKMVGTTGFTWHDPYMFTFLYMIGN